MLNFSNITSFFKRNKKILYYTGFFVILFMISGNDVFAGDPIDSIGPMGQTITPSAVTGTQVGKDIIGWVNIVLVIAAMFVGMLTQLVSLFLNPGWINGSIIGLDFYMKDIWILISNVVYFIFALLLIIIAFMNIIGKGDKWELKQALPKFIIGVLIVPFSWFMVQFILSISAILTVSAISLPFDTFPTMKTGGSIQEYLDKTTIPKECTINIGDKSFDKLKKAGTATGTTAQEQAKKVLNEMYNCKGEISISKIINNSDTIFGVIGIYTYGILKVDKFDTMTSSDASFINTIVSLGVQGIINAIFLLVMLILLGALGLALFTRGVWLWLYAMFSPVFGLMYFFDKKEGGDGALGNFSFMEFIKLALVPVYVGAALSFGLMFIFIVISGLGLDKPKGVSGDSPVKFQNNGATIKLGELSLTINGSILGNGSNKNKSAPKKSILDILQGGAGTLIVGLLGIVVLWMAVMAAIKSSKITGAVVEPIASFGKSIGDLAMKSPQYAPIFGGMSAQGLGQAGNLVKQHYSNKSIKTGSDWIDKNTSFGNDPSSKMSIVNSKYDKSVLTSIEQVTKYHGDMALEIKDLDTTLSNSSTREKLFEMIKKIYGDAAYNAIEKTRNKTDFYTQLHGVTLDSTASAGGKRYFDKFIKSGSKQDVIKIFEGGKVVEEGKAGGMTQEEIDKYKKGGNINVNIRGASGVSKGVSTKIEEVGAVLFTLVNNLDDKSNDLRAVINGKGYKVTFENSSKDAFDKSKTSGNIETAILQLGRTDSKQLLSIISELNGPDQEKFLKKIFKTTTGTFSKALDLLKNQAK